ncbi:hypothetical protein ACSBR2_010665 [Camellia fascicularis]
MRREGRQHGMVRTYPVLPMNTKPESRSRFNRFDSPPTAGSFTKVAPKPTNHSRFTGKCGRPRCRGCHQHPASKSINKTKATHKLRSANLVSNCRLATWRVVDAKPGLNFPGFSVSRVLDYLDNNDYWDEDGDDDDDDDCEDEAYEEDSCDEESEATTSFCDVGLVWERVDEDEGWCLIVGEM